MSEYYILDGKTAVPVADGVVWAEQFDRSTRCVARTETPHYTVSTVFLGMNHAYDDGPPMLFETMVFGGPLEGAMERCSTWDEAEAQHAAMVARCEAQP